MKTLDLLRLSILKTSAIAGGQCECRCRTRNGRQVGVVSKTSSSISECGSYCHDHGLFMHDCSEIITDKETRRNLRKLHVYFLDDATKGLLEFK